MANERKLISIENTRFIWQTNFAGDPSKDTFGSDARKACIVIPDVEQAEMLMDEGFNIKCTKPKPDEEEGFVPTYYTTIKANYNANWPPKIYLVSGNSEPLLLNEDTVGLIDAAYVLNVNVTLNPYEKFDKKSLYIRTMYVEQDVEDDPFADRYRRRDEVPF